MNYNKCYSAKFIKYLLYRIYIETYKIFVLMISWPVVVSILFIHNINDIKMKNVSSKDLTCVYKEF